MAITAANTAWAIGTATAMITGALAKWNGSAWSWVTDPVAGPYHPLNSIAAGPGGTAFMVGSRLSGASQVPFSAKLAGTAWQKVTVSTPAGAALNAVTFAPGGPGLTPRTYCWQR